MSVLISGVLMNPAGVPVSGAEVTFSALTNGPSVLNGFSASVMTDQDGNYSIPLEICEYAISIQSDGYNSVYGSVSINEKSTPATINELLKLAAMEQTVTPAIIVYFREIQTDVAAKLATMQALSDNATTAASTAIAAKNEAVQYAQALSAAVAQAQQASASATASANTATAAKNSAETAAGNAQATFAGAMKKSANGADIVNPAAFRENIGLSNAMLKGEFGWGGSTPSITTPTLNDFFVINKAPSGIYSADPSVVAGMPPGYGPCVIIWEAGQLGAFGILTAIDVTNANNRIARNILMNENWQDWDYIAHYKKDDPGFVRNALAEDYHTKSDFDLAMRLQQSMGSSLVNGVWKSFLSVRHRGGNGTDSPDWGYAIIDASMTQGNYNDFELWKTQAGVWLPPVKLWHTGNLNPASLNATQTFQGGNTIFKGANSFILEAASTGALMYIPFYDAGRVERKGWIGRGLSGSDNMQFTNDVTSANLQLLATGDVVLNPKAGNIVRVGAHQIVDAGLAQTIGGAKTFSQKIKILRNYPAFVLETTFVPENTIGRVLALEYEGLNKAVFLRRVSQENSTGQQRVDLPMSGNGTILVAGVNAVADGSGFYKTASPVINIYSDGSFTTTHEAIGVNVERLSEGVYKITGCQGMHSDAAWNGIDGGVSNPKCRNDKALLWNNYEVAEDGSVTVYTFHRVHPDAMPFAQNRLTLDKQPFDAKKGHKLEETWPDQSPIDVPRGAFIQVRVNMPERIAPYHAISHSNVYCNTIFLA
ncbi:prophage tail fiber N-terminal domain-containing protein [Pectobacterium parmentieri]|uniref:phage tail fiber protein n=1 Tax=Pectobacterium parmentieri TaxID=1905730 RepID=UPI0018E01A27|nr:prophage tail fiber N-terminal domain-containing protein [Pectobacterium parmentieri]MBI0552595.1 hypothetical protein [Pectobacterium parmentieri]MBI0561618.1 hypothetical protein [Pectobacterium parmentieri]MBI0565904.1 hypothetical protein [Pectobacterium parmentieri]